MNEEKQNRRILVIDDNRAIHEDFYKILRTSAEEVRYDQARTALFGGSPRSGGQEQFELDCADQGQQALAMVRSALKEGRPYAVAFVDMRMPPGWDGLETVEQLWKEDPQLEVVICTAYSDQPWAEITHRIGRNDKLLILQKPFNSIEVLQLAIALSRKWNLAHEVERQLSELNRRVDERTGELQRANDEQKQLQRQFQQAQKMEAIGRLAGGVAHDFNNLLTVITGCSAILLEQVRSDDPVRVLIEEISKAGERAATLTRQLLAFSRQQMLKPQRVDLNESLKAIASMLKRLMGADIELAVECAPDLWPVHVDRGQIDQVVMNLAVNARDAMPDGGTLTIGTSNFILHPGMSVPHPVFVPGEYVHLTIRDTGHGMDETIRSRIFEPFFTTKEEGKGTGLGLATVYGIIKQSQGFIFVESAPGKGATFDVYFPRFVGQDAAPVAAVSPHTTRGTERLLLVEDQESVRKLVGKALEGYGYQVSQAANGEEALRLAAAMPKPVDALVTDIVMPVMTGPAVAERLRVQWPSLKVLFMSGFTEWGDAGFLNAPGTKFIQKPFRPDDLARQLRHLLEEPFLKR
jgi:signal transduction histidine kinase